MTQSAKIIDVTRSFIPVDPNAYPENLHGTGGEDSPEQRVPVVPYIGANFLPTAYGYKSFFGTNSKLDMLTLYPNKADHVFVFQTVTYLNILVALCDTGVWAKNASSNGGWSQVVALAAPADDVFAEWTFCIIKNKLYVFRNNAAAYWVIDTDVASPVGVTITAKVPNFITIANQLGMFRLGARLGFWDGNNAIAYCNPDDLLDFTPSVLTGANVTTFNSVTGKIAAIRPHGQDVIVYASKSIVLLQVQPAQTFLIKAVPIFSNAGTAYLHQSTEGVPDNTHYCYTDIGIYRIVNGKEELIVPEVFDYFKPWANTPIYLKFLQGRYLCFELIDPAAIAGHAQFSKGVIPASTLTFPGGTNDSLDQLQLEDPNDVSSDTMCDLLAKIDAAAFPEQKAAADAAVPLALRKPGTGVQPQYTCHLSLGNVPTLPIAWTAAPCGSAKPNGGNFLPSPGDANGKIAGFTTNATGKTTKTGADSWTDGKWTMERFVQYQTAVWSQQQKAIEEFLTQLKDRSETDTKVTVNSTTCAAGSPALASCDLGRYPTGFSAPQFGFNKCSFWLTRYINGATDVVNKSHVVTTCVNNVDILQPDGYMVYILGNPFDGILYASEAAAVAAMGPTWSSGPTGGGGINATVGTNTALSGDVHTLTNSAGGFTRSTKAHYTAAAGKITAQQAINPYPALPTITQSYPVGHSDETKVGTSFNQGTDVTGSLGVETAWCEITGYTYTDVNGAKQTMAATACNTADDKYPGGANGATRQVPAAPARPNLLDPDGSMCGLPFETPIFDGGGGTPTTWDDQSVTYPASSFLLQVGSIAPKFPTFVGAFVYDTHLKKWGKLVMEYKQLFNYSPINSVSASTVDFGTFGILAGVLKADGFIWLFDDKPADSYLTWGKIGYYRKGMTDLQEVRFDFASLSHGSIIMDTSLDGASLGTQLHEEILFTSARQAIVYPSYSGKWHNVTITGKFDVSYLEVTGLQKGRR